MQDLLSFPSLDVTEAEMLPPFNVVIAYENLEAGKHAKRTYDYLVEQLGHECRFHSQMWKFDVLAVPKLREMAAKDAAAADIVIISIENDFDFPLAVKTWIELWLADTTNAIALVALIPLPEDIEQSPARAYLAEVARRGKMEFFSQPCLSQTRNRDEEHGSGSHWDRTGKTFSILSGAMQDPPSFSHWGINE